MSRAVTGVLASLIALLVLLAGASVILEVLDDSRMLHRSVPATSHSVTQAVDAKVKL